MVLNRLMWLFGALFVLFGLPLAVVEDGGWARVWGGLSLLSLGGFALAMAGDGMVKGQIRVQFSRIQRTTQPWLFWATIALVSATGVVVIITAVWVLFFKTW